MSSGPILAIDTATPRGGIALWHEDCLLTQSLLTIPREHSKCLFPVIEAALRSTKVSKSELGAIAVTIGPGSFTGLRIGLSAAKGLCTSLKIPLIPVSTLQVLAARILWSSRPVACLLDARRGELYCGVYDTSAGVPECLEAPRAVTVEDLLVRWSGHDVTFTGDGVGPWRDELSSSSGAVVAPASVWAPDAAALGWLASMRLAQGDSADFAAIEPEYLRTPTFVTSAEQAARAQ